MASNFNLSDDEDSLSTSSDQDLLKEEFQNAAERLQLIHSALSTDVLLRLYALYKQATVGECNIPKPYIFNSQGRAKWNAWNDLGKMSAKDAMQKYIEEMYSLDAPQEDTAKKPNMNFSFICQSQPVVEEQPLPDNEKTIFDYVKENNLEKFKNHIIDKSLVNHLGDDGLGLIHWAADRNASEIIECLLFSGADVNLKDEDGQTALHYASSCGNVDCVRMLLQKGADKELIDLAGMTCYDVAFDDNIEQILKSS